MLSNFGSNSTVSFMPWNLPFKYLLIFLFYLPFSFSFLSFLYFLSLSSFLPLPFSFFSSSYFPFFPSFCFRVYPSNSYLNLKGMRRATSVAKVTSISCCHSVFSEKVTCAPIIMKSDAPTHSLLLCLSLQHPEIMRVFHIKKLYQTVSQCHGYYHLVRNYSIVHILLKSLGSPG